MFFGAMAVMAPIVMVTPSLADYMVDGLVGDNEYSTLYDVGFVGPATDPGKLYLGLDGGDLYGALILPTAFVDNSYGANSVGWGGTDHPLSKLLKSDSATIKIAGEDIKLDYAPDVPDVAKDDGKAPKDDGKAPKAPKDDGKAPKDDGGGATEKYKTSLDYNYETFGPSHVPTLTGLFDDDSSTSPLTDGLNDGKLHPCRQ